MIKIRVGECYYYKIYYNTIRIIRILWKSSRSDRYMIEVIKGPYYKIGRCFYYKKRLLEKYCKKIPKLKRMLLYEGI